MNATTALPSLPWDWTGLCTNVSISTSQAEFYHAPAETVNGRLPLSLAIQDGLAPVEGIWRHGRRLAPVARRPGRRKVAFAARAGVLVLIVGAAGACNGDEPKLTPDNRDVRRIVNAVSSVVYQCLSVEAGYTDRPDAKVLRRDVDFLVDAWSRLRADARFRTPTGTTTLRDQSRVAVRRLDAGCAPKQASMLRDAIED